MVLDYIKVCYLSVMPIDSGLCDVVQRTVQRLPMMATPHPLGFFTLPTRLPLRGKRPVSVIDIAAQIFVTNYSQRTF